MNEHPKWDSYFLDIAHVVSTRAKCLKRTVGAVIVKDRQIIGTGYNGPVSGFPHCEVCKRGEEEAGKNYDACPAVHAELNSILLAARNGQRVKGATIYCTDFPCNNCLKAMINAGIAEVVVPRSQMRGLYRDMVAMMKNEETFIPFYGDDAKRYIHIRGERE